MKLRVVDITHFREETYIAEDGTEHNETVDVSLEGRFVVHVEYLADDGTVIQTTTADFPATVSPSEALTRLQETGQRINSARARVTELLQHKGKEFPI